MVGESNARNRSVALTTLAAWLMALAFAISTVHEVYRATVKAGVSQYDSLQMVVTRTIPFYLGTMVVVIAMGFRVSGAAWAALALAVAMLLISAFYYNPIIMAARQPGRVDWAEGAVSTGLLSASGVLLAAHVARSTPLASQ
jgi:uncharacterized membrane protein YczE